MTDNRRKEFQTMLAKRYIVSLTEEERQSLEKLTTTGKAAAKKINYARIM